MTLAPPSPHLAAATPKLSVPVGSVEIGGPPGRLNGPFNRWRQAGLAADRVAR